MQDVQKARSLLWALSAPLILLAGELGLVAHARHGLAGAASTLDERALACGVEVPSTDNPAKALSMHLTSGLPLVWGSGDLGAVAARRLGRQLAENADWPSVVGVLPEAVRTHAGLLAGPWAQRSPQDDLFRDRTLDEQPQPRLRVMLLRDASEHPDTSAIAEAVVQTCERVAVPYESVMAHGGHAIEQLADLVGLVDFASVYTALMQRRDPSRSAGDLDPGSVTGIPGSPTKGIGPNPRGINKQEGNHGHSAWLLAGLRLGAGGRTGAMDRPHRRSAGRTVVRNPPQRAFGCP